MHFLTLDGASFLISAIAVSLIGARPTRSHRARLPFGVTLLRGFLAIRRHRLLGFLLATSGINNGAWYAAMFLGLPLLLTRNEHASMSGLRGLGAAMACYGVINLAGNLIIGNRPMSASPARLIFSGNMPNDAGIC
jgi:hypothetical protein